MKVYFDDDGVLRHFGCEGQMFADVEISFLNAPITDGDQNWGFGEFSATVDVDNYEWNSGIVTNVVCARCDARGMSLVGKVELDLVTEDELNGQAVEEQK